MHTYISMLHAENLCSVYIFKYFAFIYEVLGVLGWESCVIEVSGRMIWINMLLMKIMKNNMFKGMTIIKFFNE